MEHNESDFIFLVYDITHTIGNLYTKEEVDELLTASAEDPDQEYMTKYKAGSESIFGTVSNEDMQGPLEWGQTDEEWDDSYIEDRSDDDLIHHAV